MDLEIAQRELQEASADFEQILEKYSISDDDVVSTRVSFDKKREYHRNEYVFVGYSSSVSNHVIIRNLKTLDALYTECLLNKRFSISRLEYSHSQMDSIEDVAYQNALTNAYHLADELLKDMPEQEKRIIQISNQPLPNLTETVAPGNNGASKARYENSAPVRIHHGNLLRQRNLYVHFVAQ